MARNLSLSASYHDQKIILTTKHDKARVIAPAFKHHLGANVMEFLFDTDSLGTFSGEVERKGDALDCVKHKCELGLLHENAIYGLASEGSFGPHPYIPFMACDREVLYFIDKQKQFSLHISSLSEKTNYQMKKISAKEELLDFAKLALFPTHALIIRPNVWRDKGILFKGIQSDAALDAAFIESCLHSDDHEAWVMTDMRAHVNPSRMSVIAKLAEDLAQRLARNCPACIMPGWGMVDVRQGLPCELCHQPTQLIKNEIWGCVKCAMKEELPRYDGKIYAEAKDCAYCNP